MFGIGPGELVVIILVALVVLGPEKLPTAARVLGRLSAELRHLSTEFQRTLHADDVTPPPRPAARNEADSAGNAASETAAAPNGLSGSQEDARPEPDALENEAYARDETLSGQGADGREANAQAANTGGANTKAAFSGESSAPGERGKT